MCYFEDYIKGISGEAHEYLTKSMSNLQIGQKAREDEKSLALDSEIDPTNWKFVKLLSDIQCTPKASRQVRASNGNTDGSLE